jgi:hypothetical protein
MKDSRPAIRALLDLTRELETNPSLRELSGFRERIKALDRLDAYRLDQPFSCRSVEAEIQRRARSLYAELEAINMKFYENLRLEIQRGNGPNTLLQGIFKSDGVGDTIRLASGESYDHLDEFVAGILRFAQPGATIAPLPAEMVPYQPTPARHIFDFVNRAQLTEQDVLVDLGSGLGHVSLLASICTGTRSIGIEMESAYVNCARQSAYELGLENVTFIARDAREADLSCGSIFYLYTPFLGAVLRAVLDSLRREAAARKIRVCTFGPCTPIVHEEQWLKPIQPVEAGQVAVFRSGN